MLDFPLKNWINKNILYPLFMKCEYCDLPSHLVECTCCSKYFCNSRSSSSISHIIFHLVKTKHKTIKLKEDIMCLKCSEDNVFKLAKYDDKIYCKSCMQDATSIIEERCLTLIDCPNIDNAKKLTKQQMTEIEEACTYSLPSVKSKFEAEEYVQVFSALIEAECKKEKEIKESMKQSNVVIRWENMKYGYFYFQRADADLKINMGDEIKLSHKSGLVLTGFISNDSFTEELKFEVDVPGDYPRSGYVIEYIWRGVCYERMLWALNKLYNTYKRKQKDRLMTGTHSEELQDDLSIFEYILKGRKEFLRGSDEILMPPNLPKLNKPQEIAVRAAMSRKVTLIQGPPGTGKTLVSSAIVYNYVKRLKGKVLVVAPSNTAVDQLTLKIHKTGVRVLRVMSRRREYTQSDVNFLSLHENLKELQEISKNRNGSFNNIDTLQDDENDQLKKQLLLQAEVITCTCVTAGQKMFNKMKFACVLVDEAVQSTEPLNIIPLVYGCTKLVLVGDHKQLGPTILCKKVAKAGFKQSLFERLISVGVSPYILSLQYRMHPYLCEWPSETFYNGELQTGNRTFYRFNLGIPLNFFYACYGKEEVSASGTSFVNQVEALYCESIIRHLFKSGITENQIGVITPYEGQRSHILNRIFGLEPGNLEISNVDGFQGREKDFIIVSLVRSNLYQGIGFVGDKRRMNVALTRAKHGLIIIGNPSTLVKHEMWKSLLEFYDRKGLIFEGSLGDLKRCPLVKPKKIFDFKSIAESINLK